MASEAQLKPDEDPKADIHTDWDLESNSKKRGSWVFVQGQWRKIQHYKHPPISQVSRTRKKLKFVTYNVWFSEYKMEERAHALFDILRELKPDVICLQEVTRPVFLRLLAQQKWVRDEYEMSDAGQDRQKTFMRYGVVVLSKIPILEIRQQKFPSQMDRRLIMLRLNVNGKDVYVGSVHLESLEYAGYRRAQLRISNQVFQEMAARSKAEERQHSFSALMGDFNIDDRTNFKDKEEKELDDESLENHNIKQQLDGFEDLWLWEVEQKSLDPKTPEGRGVTRDRSTNAFEKAELIVQQRIDRVVYDARCSDWKPALIQRLGTRPFADDSNVQNGKVFASDHFGLYSEFDYVASDADP